MCVEGISDVTCLVMLSWWNCEAVVLMWSIGRTSDDGGFHSNDDREWQQNGAGTELWALHSLLCVEAVSTGLTLLLYTMLSASSANRQPSCAKRHQLCVFVCHASDLPLLMLFVTSDLSVGVSPGWCNSQMIHTAVAILSISLQTTDHWWNPS